ncbi:MAG: hypothetical protein ACD_20C00049G0004 [uncultured bacterium]|nr:MAG: hypothetical protein ACD_20C00049G0004 [uncultured bacterium]HBY01304.1 hypothetical protein [Rikenellaceae bacterium]
MKNIKYIISLVFLLALLSCNKDAVMPTIDSANIGTVGAAFASPVLVYNLKATDNNVIKVLVYRGNTKAAASVPVTLTSASSGTLALFSLPVSNVEFAAGEGSAYLSVNYTMASIAPAKKYTFALTLVGDDLISPSKISVMTVNAQLPLAYISLGTGSYTSEFYETTANVAVLKADLPTTLPSYYRIIEPYEPGSGANIDFSVDNGVITIASQNIGWLYSASYGYVYVTPQTTSVSGKTYTWVSKFTLPTAGMAFGGTYAESVTLP